MIISSKFFVLFLTYFVYSTASLAGKVRFSLHNARNSEEVITIRPGSFCHELYPFDRSTKVFLIIHGWLQSSREFYISDIRNLIFRALKKDVVFISADWSAYAGREYDVARRYNSVVANATSDVLSSFLGWRKLKPDNTEIICHCMGCHIAGMACKNLFPTSRKKIGRITALDPAGPGYYSSRPLERLGAEDASVVFVIHTDAFRFGFGERCGTIDFYPNGGRFPQPGCLNFTGIIDYNLCSHQRSIELYVESLDDPVFYGIKCPSYRDYKSGLCSSNSKLNFASVLKADHSGTYFYSTNSRKPFLRKK
ncbi:lipoprotein lipase-like [Coccinella septempunctata]|uniref:lipoprotein lipase-like n=1 Tax=Coccinella septempunctata TaxID=41139 RepID=UPI001D087606|nr:lipoprotein lipase-like [Coccinella septempunctata]